MAAMGALLPLAWRLARRELRGGLRGFRVFLACLGLGVAVIAAVGSLGAAVEAGLHGDARAMLGGDVELRLANRPADARELAWLGRAGRVSAVASLRSMARRDDGARRSLIELKAVDQAYPLYGAVALDPALPEAPGLAAALARRQGVWGAAVAPDLLSRLDLRLGDRIRVGDAELELRAVIAQEPDLGSAGLSLGPKVMIALDALPATGLLAPGTLVTYLYRLRLPPTLDRAAWSDAAHVAFPDSGWRIRDFANANPSLERLLDRVRLFLTLVGLTALLVGGVGVGNAVRSFLAGKTATIATLKCLGAPARLIFATYLAQILVLAGLGIGGGLVVGALAPLGAVAFLPAQLPVEARLGLYPLPLLVAAGFGLLTTLAFSLWPLGLAREVPAGSLFRSLVDPLMRRPRPVFIAATAVAAGAMAALAVATAADRGLAAWSVAGAAGALLALRLVASAVTAAARRVGRPRHPGLRLALGNLYRPGATTGGVVTSLGLGLTVLVAIALVQGNLARLVDDQLPASAPSFFFVDIQPDQVQGFDRLVAGFPGTSEVARVPSLRCRITALNGVPVDQARVDAEAQWALRSERGLTYAAAPPRGSRIVAGSWWPADYRGPPLVSFDAELARGMGLKLGDTITINLLGREITATIANLREIDWAALGINFVMVFAPGTLEGAPQTHIATARVAPDEEDALERAVTDRFPNVTSIPVRDALALVSRIVAAIGTAIRVTAAVALAAGALVLAGAIAAGHRRRVYEAVVLKVLGATRGDVTRAFLIEYGLLGAVSAAIAAVFGTLAAYLVLTRVMHSDWVFLPLAVGETVLLAVALTLAVGYAGTWRALGAKAAPLLRNE